MPKQENLTQQELKELLDYNPDTGIFTWKQDRRNVRAGDQAGFIHSGGGIQIGINQQSYRASHLAYLYMTGKFPEKQLKFADKDKCNLKYKNLYMSNKSSIRKWLKAICPSCGEIRKVYRGRTTKHPKIDGMLAIPCYQCSHVKRTIHSFESSVEIGNCTIVPSYGRCEQGGQLAKESGEDTCPFYDRCLTIALKNHWPGWTNDGENRCLVDEYAHGECEEYEYDS